MYLYNARIYTQNAARPLAEALAIEGGRILAVGDSASIRSAYGGRMQGIDLHGQVVIPGLVDAHIHLESYSQALQYVDCETATRQECLERVAERARQAPPGAWILGHGWNQNNWLDGYGTAADLDAVVPDHPVFLTSKSMHCAWVNSAALHLAGIGSDTPDPLEGRIGRDAHGNPDGILFEDTAQLIENVLPQPAPDQVVEAIHAALPGLWRMGLTGVHDFDRRTCFVALQILHQRGDLRLRVLKSIPLEDLPSAAAMGLRSGFGDDWLRIGSVKCFADGALGPRTAAMLQPYEEEPQNHGMLMLDAEELFERGRLAVENGISLAVHAIGDRANHEVLNAFERLRALEGVHSGDGFSQGRVEAGLLRHRIEHVQIIHPQDAGRLAELGLVASMQPIHATSDMLMADRYWGERSAWSYAWKTQLHCGATLAFGSDAPVESPNPFWGLHAAVTRQRLDGSPGPQGWHSEQRLTVEQALYAYTVGAAYAAGWEDRLGRLSQGFLADLLVLDVDPFTCPPDQLPAISPVATMIGGEWVYP
jgi:predicted amidohydrolase YtcJ